MSNFQKEFRKMKKLLITTLLMCIMSICFSRDYSSAVFKDCFEKANESYEFYIRNPLFIDKFYVKDLASLKNKILKQTIEIYDLDEQKRKSYSDSYTRTVDYYYYFFDSEGRITDYYYIEANDNDIIFYKTHENYNCKASSYEITQENYLYKTKKTIKGLIEKNDNLIILSFDSDYNNHNKMEFSKNKILKEKLQSEDRIRINEFIIKNTNIQETEYDLNKGEIKYYRNSEYEKGGLVEYKYFRQSGDETYKYEMDNSGHGILTYVKESTPPKKENQKEVYRRFNQIGFLEYEEKKPYNKEVGNYSSMTVNVLSKEDDFFIKHFK